MTDVRSWANGTFKGNVPECKAKLIEQIEKYAKAHEKDAGFVERAETQMCSFLNKEGIFGQQTMIERAKRQQAHVFFDLHGATIPDFAEVAMRLAAKVSSSGGAERDHKNTKHIWTKARNRLEAEKVAKLKHRYSANLLKTGNLDARVVDSSKEMAKYYETADYVDPYIPPVTTDANSTATAVASDAANAWSEAWEKPLLIIDEKSDPTARFRLLTKLRGLCLRDTDEDYDDYRVVCAFLFDVLLTH